MKLHSDTITYLDIHDALKAAKATGLVAPQVILEKIHTCGSRSRKVGYEIVLRANYKVPGDKRRRPNSGAYGAGDDWAATYIEWGVFIAELFDIDHDAIFGSYKGYDHFHKVTGYVFS